MKLTLDRLAVKDALSIGRRPLARMSGRTARLPCVKGVHIVANQGAAIFDRTDLDVFSQVIADAEVHDLGEALVSEKRLRDAVQRGDDQVTLVLEDGKLAVDNGEATITVPTFDLDEWPQAPQRQAPSTTFDPDAFDRLLRVASAASEDDDRPVLTAVSFSEEAVVATDSYRLHWTGGVPGAAEALVPASLFTDSAKESKRTKRYEVAADDDRAWVTFETGRGRGGERELSVVYSAKLIDGTYPNWQRLVPEADELVGTMTFPVDELAETLDALSPVTKLADNIPVSINPVSGIIQASYDGSDAASSVSGTTEGEVPTLATYSPSFLLDAAQAVGSETVTAQWQERETTAVQLSGGDVSVLLMPVRT